MSLKHLLSAIAYCLICVSSKADTFTSAECLKGASLTSCTVDINSDSITIAPNGSSQQAVAIKPSQIISYDYFKKSSEGDMFASGYHSNVVDRLAKNYSYTLTWKTEAGATEKIVISLNNAEYNRMFYPLMRKVTGLELGIER